MTAFYDTIFAISCSGVPLEPAQCQTASVIILHDDHPLLRSLTRARHMVHDERFASVLACIQTT